MIKKILNYIKIHKIISAIALVVVIILGYWIFGGGENVSPFDFYQVDIGEVTQEVSSTGKVVAAKQADLSFEKSGLVVGVFVNEGDYVFAGQYLAKLEDTEIKAQVAEAEASLSGEEIKLLELEKGTRSEEIEIAKNDLKNAYLPVLDILQDAKKKIEDALYKQTDPLFDNDDTSPQLTFTISDSQTEVDVKIGRLEARDSLLSVKSAISSLKTSDYISMNESLSLVKKSLSDVENFLSISLQAVNVEVGLSDTTASTYKTNITTARTNIQNAIEAITTQQKLISSASRNLSLKEAGSTEEGLRFQESQVERAKAQLDNIKAQLAKTILVSPINAVVTKKSINVGEYVSTGSIAFSVISNNLLEVESNVPEVDIAKIKKGNKARITLDAYGSDENFEAKVARINPAETLIEGVSTYKVTLSFDNYNEKI